MTDISPATILDASNSIRQNLGLLPLSESPALEKVAQDKTHDLCNQNYWAHDGPGNDTWTHWYAVDNVSYDKAGENLAYGFVSSERLMTAWVNSPEHYRNITEPGFTETGSAAYLCPSFQGKSNQIIVAAEFRKPSTPIAQTSVGQAEPAAPIFLQLQSSSAIILSLLVVATVLSLRKWRNYIYGKGM